MSTSLRIVVGTPKQQQTLKVDDDGSGSQALFRFWVAPRRAASCLVSLSSRDMGIYQDK